MEDQEKSFIQNIWDNRFVKYIFSYSVGAWGIIQVAAFLESRYAWAIGWPDFILIFALVLLPSVILFSYHQRAAKSDELTKTEKIFFPVNFILAIAIAILSIGKSDLNANTPKVTVLNEEGQEVERFIPHTSSIKRLVVLPWALKGDDEQIQWMTFALPEILGSDLEQDSRLIAVSPLALANEYDEYSAHLDQALPFSIQKKIASDNYSDFFMQGSIEKNGDIYQISTTLFNTKDGKEIYNKSYENTNPLELVDLISEDFRNKIYIENELDQNFVDLPVSNLYTSSLEALKYYSESIKQSHYYKNNQAAIENIQKAITIDPSFAFAYAQLSIYHLVINQLVESKAAINKAIQLKDVLSERMQFDVKYRYLNFDEPIKALDLLEMWSQLHPKDSKPYSLLISRYQLKGEMQKAKLTAERALNNGQSGTILLKLARLENIQGNTAMAEQYYDQFEKEFPHKVNDILGKGNIYLSNGEFDKAEAHFEKLHLLNPDKSKIIKELAKVQGKKGNFKKQLEKLELALELEKQFQDSVAIMQSIEFVYLNMGQIDKYFEVMKERWQVSSRYLPLSQQSIELMYPHNIQAALDQGREEGLLDRLLLIANKMDNSVLDFSCAAKCNYYLFVNDAENTNKTMDTCLEDLKKFHSEAQLNYIYALIEKVNGNYSKAIDYLDILKKQSGIDPAHLGFFSEIYRLNKEYEKAEKQLNASLKIDPFNATLLYELATTHYEQGKKEEAKSALQQALEVWQNADANYMPAQEARLNMTEWF